MLSDEGIRLDLRKDLESIRSFFRSASRQFVSRHPDRIITGIQVAFFLPGDYLEITFFDDPNFLPMDRYDGIESARRFYLQHWSMWYEILGHLPTQTVGLEGELISTAVTIDKLYYPDGSKEVIEAMGLVMVRAIQLGRGEVFESLQKAVVVKIGVYVFGDEAFDRYLTIEDGNLIIHAEHP